MTKKIDTSTIGGRIKKLRTDKGLSQEELAELLYLNAKNISAYENNRNVVPSPVLDELARALDSDMDYIFTGVKKFNLKPEYATILEKLDRIENKAHRKLAMVQIDAILDAILVCEE